MKYKYLNSYGDDAEISHSKTVRRKSRRRLRKKERRDTRQEITQEIATLRTTLHDVANHNPNKTILLSISKDA
jgi:ribosomal protein L21E